MTRMDVDPAGINIMSGKGQHLNIQLGEVSLKAALILKQDMLSIGGEAALSRRSASLTPESTPVLLMGTMSHFRLLADKLAGQPFGLAQVGSRLVSLLGDRSTAPSFVVGGLDLLGDEPVAVMGVLNVTEDSFSDGGSFLETDKAIGRGRKMADEGALIIDVGGESTRPGARSVEPRIEAERVLPVLDGLNGRSGVYLSVDTTRSQVAEAAFLSGAAILNDISGMTFDERMADTAAAAGASVILMHTRDRPEVMQDQLDYEDLVGEVFSFLDGAVNRAMEAGIGKERICVDPGIGFGKSFEQNLVLINRLEEFRSLGCAVMVGTSRKSFIGHYLDAQVNDRMEGSLATAVAAVMRGASLIRCHDVRETVRAVRMAGLVRNSTDNGIGK
jgi:dihydropteroate synthase